jgi:hypothetical protein
MATNKSIGGEPKLPVRQLAILGELASAYQKVEADSLSVAACRFSEPLAFTSVFPYLVFAPFLSLRTNHSSLVG